ncbi:MAG TPA: hypothetical protein VKC61_11795 [Pyrinomonadaceae bacterium]|nr:hypothetical protein [Pyrinomonadaceae bacterium]
MRFLSSTRIVRVSLALTVAFWMAGAGCMLGCANMASAATATEIASPANSSAIVVSGEACASMQSHDCCAKRNAHSAAKPETKPTSGKPELVAESRKVPSAALFGALGATFPSMMECPLAVNATAELSKAGPDQSNVALPSPSELASLSNPPEQTSAFARPLRLPNRGHTYLHCCSFLI